MPLTISVPTDFSDARVERIAGINKDPLVKYRIGEVYGCLPQTILGSVRKGVGFPEVNMEKLARHIASAGAQGLKFKYVVSSLWFHNTEAALQGRRAMHQHIEELVSCGVRHFSVSASYLARFIRKHFPGVAVSAAIFSHIENQQQLRQYLAYGVERATVIPRCNRRFAVLRSFCAHPDLGVEVIANPHSLSGNRHDSLINAVENPGELVKIPWIRPEDIHFYEEAGVSSLIISGRGMAPRYVVDLLRAYTTGSFDGNLLCLLALNCPKDRASFSAGGGDPMSIQVYLDNRALDGFIAPFADGSMDCQEACEACGYCARMAAKAMEINRVWQKGYLESIKTKDDLGFDPVG